MSDEKKGTKKKSTRKKKFVAEVIRPFRIYGTDYKVGDSFEAKSAEQLRILIEEYKYLRK